jgi:alcohol dehydrogenase (cytochrome c)
MHSLRGRPGTVIQPGSRTPNVCGERSGRRPIRSATTHGLGVTLTLLIVAASPSSAQRGGGGQAAAYSAAQAAAGAEIYGRACANCHLPTLQGSFEAPQLAGANFRSAWGSKPVAQLLETTRQKMPTQAPGSLSQDEYVAVIAYILRQNGVAPSEAQLSFTSPGRVLAAAAGARAAPAAPKDTVYPEPGRLGNVRSAFGVDRKPKVGEIHESETALTITYHRADRFTPATDSVLASPPARDWLHWRGTLNSWGYSRLAQVDTKNVHRLQLAWSWGMQDGISEPAPLVRNGVLFVVNGGNVIQALDGTNGTLLWEYHYKFPKGASTRGRLRNVALWEDMIYVATETAMMVALDARTGQVRWEAKIADWKDGFENSSGPIVVNGMLVDGINGCNQFVQEKCFLFAMDARTGKELWRTHTVALPGDPGDHTWGKLPVLYRGGAESWIPGSWDPKLGLLYFGTAQSKPWVAASRGLTTEDSTLYANSTLAVDPKTGKIVWYFQHVPGESLDLDVVYERVLIDVEGRPLVLTIGKDGLLWKLDRRTGAFVGVTETVYQNVFEKLDHETGALRYRKDIREAKIGDWISSCPSTAGGHNWHATAYHPATHNLVIPLAQTCFEIMGQKVEQEPGGGGNGGVRAFFPAPGSKGNIGRLAAYNVLTMKEAWNVQQRSSFTTAALTTAGGLVFVGSYDRYFRAYDVATGKQLWETRLATSSQGFPITYEVDGVQYVVAPAGREGGSPWNVTQFLTPDIVTPDGDRHNGLYVFKLAKP